MGRHSSHSQFTYYRSVVGWALPWFLIAAVFATVVWFAVDALGGDSTEKPPKVASAAETPSPDESESPTPKKSPSPSPKEEPKDDSPFDPDAASDPGSDPNVKLITEGITIQVLNGTASSLAGTDMSNELSDLGFQVVVVNDASKAYPATTVFWSTHAAREAAEALAERFGWVAEQKPGNLTDSVSLHVVVGEDYL
jgi:LytR cell envelope-related transcriptional attenuator